MEYFCVESHRVQKNVCTSMRNFPQYVFSELGVILHKNISNESEITHRCSRYQLTQLYMYRIVLRAVCRAPYIRCFFPLFLLYFCRQRYCFSSERLILMHMYVYDSVATDISNIQAIHFQKFKICFAQYLHNQFNIKIWLSIP